MEEDLDLSEEPLPRGAPEVERSLTSTPALKRLPTRGLIV